MNDYKVLDAHVHISVNKAFGIHHKMTLEAYANELVECCENSSAICFINPFDERYFCPCNLSINGMSNHKIVMKNHNYCVICNVCGKQIYFGSDVFKDDNVQLLQWTQKKKYHALAFVSGPIEILNEQIRFYEYYYPEFKGYKIHPTVNAYKNLNFSVSETNKTLLFHTGREVQSRPEKIITFAERYQGNVVLAHCARFNMNVLSRIRHLNNVWIDMSPFWELSEHYMYDTEENDFSYSKEKKEIWDHKRNLLQRLIDIVGIEKILFASDMPFGDVKNEYHFIDSLNLQQTEKEMLFEKNALAAYKIK